MPAWVFNDYNLISIREKILKQGFVPSFVLTGFCNCVKNPQVQNWSQLQ
jgi:hypothetical protein